MRKYLALVLLLAAVNASAQHDHNHDHALPKKETPRRDTVPGAAIDSSGIKPTLQPNAPPPPGHDGHDHDHGTTAPASGTHMHDDHEAHAGHNMPMTHAFSRNLPMNRNGSGTSWLPDNAPMFGYMFHGGKWMYMFHGNLFLRYNEQDLTGQGQRGAAKWDAPNMWMFMGQRNVGSNGLFHFSTMLSLDPLTVGESGYPLLFQTGESYRGEPLVDRQHPHDLFSELSVSYAHRFSAKSDAFVYLGYPGEPALGPVAYVHRPSAFYNPDAPLSHHWTDATHITFGVATLGYRYGNWKLEGSSFTGREPDEHRYDFDRPRFDSWSGRLSFNPSRSWALQASHGFLRAPEVAHPDEDVHRSTASATFSRRGFGERFINVTALWGMNKSAGHRGEHAALLEASRTVPRWALYSRYEWVQKSTEELNLDEHQYGHDALFAVHALTLGASRDLLTLRQTKLALGTQFSAYLPDRQLQPLYGQLPLAGQVYLRLYPRAMGTQTSITYVPY
ncbi:hypothetical protein EPD60_06335 [Flaviaesturariibacter flavus]|uniref:TonB-dependent receptor n=1 Tax=Flaviaesturariibacter flavus TaxID=2502780 RepID=A0A4R1BKS1_9BACT|nr:hypothetical protein EPD60_06335 [Flaviaesturariibacter flavus]